MKDRDELESPLYHYTDANGLLGILGSPKVFPGTEEDSVFPKEPGATFGTLWATDARYLNDSKELTYGVEILATKLEERAGATTTPVVRERLTQLADDVRTSRFEFTFGSRTEKPDPHVTCFCTSGNLLSQWRGYGDGGGGFAIGFSRAALDEFIVVDPELLKTDPHIADTPIGRPVRVHYGVEETSTFLEECAEEIADGLEAVESGAKTYRWPDTFHGVAATWLAQVKHDAFQEESEWRLIVDRGDDKDRQFRAGRLGLIPYRPLYFPITKGGEPSITEIVVGPGGERQLRKAAVEQLLEKIGSTKTEVVLSEAPFRG